VPSLLGFAYWSPEYNGKSYRKGGVGTYHMEYEYGSSAAVTYPFLRRAIQIMNPSVH
jgi:endo-beta-N-acetylglucosaminidase F2